MCRLKPRSHKINRTTRTVQSMGISFPQIRSESHPVRARTPRADGWEKRVLLLIIVFSSVFSLAFGYGLGFGSVNFRKERFGYGWNGYFAQQ